MKQELNQSDSVHFNSRFIRVDRIPATRDISVIYSDSFDLNKFFEILWLKYNCITAVILAPIYQISFVCVFDYNRIYIILTVNVVT